MDPIRKLTPRYGEAPIPAPSPTRMPIANVRVDAHHNVVVTLSDTVWPASGKHSTLVEVAFTWLRDRQPTPGRCLVLLGRKNLDETIAALTSARAALDAALAKRGAP